MKTNAFLTSLYSFPGFRARSKLHGMMADPDARIITLERRQKKHAVPAAAKARAVSMTGASTRFGTWTLPGCGSTCGSSTAECPALGAGP